MLKARLVYAAVLASLFVGSPFFKCALHYVPGGMADGHL
jgi:hypothetical protein